MSKFKIDRVEYKNNRLVSAVIINGNKEIHFVPRSRHMVLNEKNKATALKLKTEIAELKQELYELKSEIESNE